MYVCICMKNCSYLHIFYSIFKIRDIFMIAYFKFIPCMIVFFFFKFSYIYKLFIFYIIQIINIILYIYSI